MSPNGVPLESNNGYLQVPTESMPMPINTDPPKECSCTKESKIRNGTDPPDQDVSIENVSGVVVPPDGGWGWVVVAGSFMCNMVVDGIIFSFGMLISDICNDFNATVSEASLVGSLLSGFYLIAGPFASALANRYGFRLVAILGSVLAALAFAASSLASSVEYLWISYGIIGGIGFGLVYVPAVITVGYYFERWRALATGIGVCGSGIGAFVFAPLFSWLIEEVGWRNTLLIQAIIILSCVIFGASFRPLKPTKFKELEMKERFEKPQLVMDSSKLPTVTRQKMEYALRAMQEDSTMCTAESQSTIPKLLGVSNNAHYPKASDIFDSQGGNVYKTIGVIPNYKITNINCSQEKRLSVPLIPQEHLPRNIDNGTTPLLETEERTPVVVPTKRHTLEPSKKSCRIRRDSFHGSRPFYRDDIFFGASLTRLPQYTSRTSVAYNLAVTRLPTKNDVEEEKKKSCKICPEAMRRILATMLDFSLLKSPCFIILAVSGALTMLGFYVPFVFLVKRAVKYGMVQNTAVWLVSTIGIANTVGRVISGMFSSHEKVNTLLVNNVALTVGGISTMLSGYLVNQEAQFINAIAFGMAISCFASLRSVLVVDLLGLEKLTNAFGLLLLFQGIAACVGSPLAGALEQATGSYDESFYLSGGIILLSAVMCYPLNVVNRWEKQKTKEAQQVVV